MWTLYDTPNPNTGKEHFGGAQYALSKFGFDMKVTVYTGILALALNLLVVIVGSFALRAAGAPHGEDITADEDFQRDPGDPGMRPLPGTVEQGSAGAR